MELNQVTLPTIDYDASVAFYKALGLVQIVDSPPRYARFEADNGATLSVHAVDELAEATGVTIYFEVDDVDGRVRELEDAGLVFESQPVDQRWLWREAYLRDPAGNIICIFHGGENRRYPPWRVPQ
jgi:catechol 2,3-dioxygenase-like lactoylglutathione lyase family enzyme